MPSYYYTPNLPPDHSPITAAQLRNGLSGFANQVADTLGSSASPPAGLSAGPLGDRALPLDILRFRFAG
jgi:hypothetical protein